MLEKWTVLIKGAGDLATAVAARLWQSGFRLALTELEQPLAIRRAVAFAEAVFDGVTQVEGIRARLATNQDAIIDAWKSGDLPVLIASQRDLIDWLQPDIVVDATMMKRDVITSISEARLVIGLGPGFTAPINAHAVVETNRGHNLGRVAWEGRAEPDTRSPAQVGGVASDRVVYPPAKGLFQSERKIGDIVVKGDVLGMVGSAQVRAGTGGVVRGLIHDGIWVHPGLKIGDIDPRGEIAYCFTISDKARAVGGGVLEAILHAIHQQI